MMSDDVKWCSMIDDDRCIINQFNQGFKGCNMMQQKKPASRLHRWQSTVIESKWIEHETWLEIVEPRTRFTMLGLSHLALSDLQRTPARLCHVSWRGGMANPWGVSGKTSQTPLVWQGDTLKMLMQSNNLSLKSANCVKVSYKLCTWVIRALQFLLTGLLSVL